jgi:hypothetical protein
MKNKHNHLQTFTKLDETRACEYRIAFIYPQNYSGENGMFQGLKTLPLVLTLAAVSIFATSCGSSSAKLRIVQAIPDVSAGQPLDIYLDGNKAASSIGFGGTFPTTGYQSTHTGSRHLQVFLAGQTTGAIFDGNITLNSGSNYTAVLSGFTTSSNIAASLFTDNNTAPSSGNVSVRIIHASPTWNYSYYQNGMDIFVVAPGTSIFGVSPTVSALGYQHASNYVSAPAGSYNVIATPPDLAAEIIVGGPYTFNSGDIRTVIFVDAPGGGLGSAPVVLNDLGQ